MLIIVALSFIRLCYICDRNSSSEELFELFQHQRELTFSKQKHILGIETHHVSKETSTKFE